VRFRRNLTPEQDSPNYEEFSEEPFQAPERLDIKDRNGKREYTALLFLKADTAVTRTDSAEFDGRWFDVKKFEPIFRIGATSPSHYEVYI